MDGIGSGELYRWKGRARSSRIKGIGFRVRALREHYMLTQDEFARRLLVSRNLLSELENGKRTPRGPLLVAIEALFMANRMWLMTGAGEMVRNGKDGPAAKAGADCAADVVDLLKGYRALSTENRKKLLNIMRVFKVIEEKEHRA